MRCLVLNGAPRRGGYTDDIVSMFTHGVESAGAVVETVILGELGISACRGCFGCWRPAASGACVIRDDMAAVLTRFEAADIIAFASPLYFHSFSGLMKTFIDRLMPLLMPSFEPGEAPGTVRNLLRHPPRGSKKGVLLMTAGHRGEKVFDGAVLTFGRIAESLGLESVGVIARPESVFMDFGIGHEKTLRRIREAVERAGEEVVRDGGISPETQAAAALPLSADADTYCRRTAAYFRVALDGPVIDRERIRQRVLDDLTIVMPSVAACYDAHSGGDLAAVLNFDISGTSNGAWRFEIANGVCTAIAALHHAADVTVATDAAAWLALLRGELDGRRAVCSGVVSIDGDRRLFYRFGRLFPSQSA